MDNVTRYREFEIYPASVSYSKDTDWQWVHKDYDGAEDARDDRCGYGSSIEDCKLQIDEWWEEQDG